MTQIVAVLMPINFGPGWVLVGLLAVCVITAVLVACSGINELWRDEVPLDYSSRREFPNRVRWDAPYEPATLSGKAAKGFRK